MPDNITHLRSINIKEIVDMIGIKQKFGKTLVTISGFAYNTFTTNTKYGESLGFKGDFVAVNAETGEVFESNVCFLPKSLTKDIEKQLDKSENKEVHFIADIGVEASDKNDRGYAWVANQPRTELMDNRKTALLKAAQDISSNVKQLPKAADKKKAG